MQATLDQNRYKDLFHKVFEEEFGKAGSQSDWDKIKLSKSLPLDVFYKLFPITATWTMRKKHHNI